MMYEPYDESTASPKDRVAWALCQIIDDDAPLRWTFYRYAAECIAANKSTIDALQELQAEQKERSKCPFCGGPECEMWECGEHSK